MSNINFSQSRVTTMLSSNQLLATLRRTQQALHKVQQQISTGRMIDKPSDSPGHTSALLALESSLEARNQHQQNLQHALGLLNTASQSLSDGTTILIEAKSIASSQVGVGSNADTRANQATVIDAQVRALMELANRQYAGVSLFGGDRGAGLQQPVFEAFLGGIRYTGGRGNLNGDVGTREPLAINSNGQDTFGALSSRVVSHIDLNPQPTAATNIRDVTGAQGVAIRLGSIRVTVNGTPVTVDLSSADKLGDVATRVQAAMDSVAPGAGTFSITANGFALTAAAGQSVSVSEAGSGLTAADLGIVLTATNGATALGAELDPRLTRQTTLTSLGAAIDFASGLHVTQGGVSKVADFSTANTIEDMINVVERLGLGLRLEINQNQTGLNLVSEVSGIELSIGENGGTTAEDLGLRTFGLNTRLADFRHGLGVETVLGADDFAIELHDGRSFNVNLDGVTNVAEALAAIQSAAAAAGVGAGEFSAGLATTGNGFALTDNTVGGGDFRVRQLGISLAATHLGIYSNAQDGNSLAGADVARVRAESVFTHLMQLRDALENDDSFGITLAGTALEGDIELLARVNADVSTRAGRVEDLQERSQSLKIAEQSLLSGLQDTEYNEAITRFMQLQQQLEASLSVGAANLQMSLLDFLR